MGTNLEFIKLLQRRTAQVAIGASSLRNQGADGVIDAARKFVGKIDLAQVSRLNAVTFLSWLNEATIALKEQLPVGAQHWGTARKAVNLFLRDVVYNRDLALHFQLDKVRPWLEVPLDKYVGAGLRRLSERKKLEKHLPPWSTIRELTEGDSAVYQQLACKVADKQGVCRVDVDVYYWRAEKGAP